MRKLSTFFYNIGQGLLNIGRNRLFSLASIGTMTACLFLFGIFYSVLTNFRAMVNEAETGVGFTVFFDSGITEEEIGRIGEAITMRAEVSRIEYTSAEAAWEKYKTEKLSAELIETFGDDNPLADSASYTVYMNDVSMQDSLVNYVKSLSGVRKVNDKADIAKSLTGINSVITVVSISIIVVLLFVATFLISTTVATGISVRAKEIGIMKLIGASNSFIRMPFLVEGAIIGLLGAVIPLVILKFGYVKIISYMEERFVSVFTSLNFIPVETVMKTLIPVSLVIGLGTGLIGSIITLNRQLHKIEVD